MGPGIALTLALGGVETRIVSRSAGRAAQAVEGARERARLLARHQLVGEAEAVAAAGRLSPSAELDRTVAECGLVIESGPEDLAFKQDLFARMDTLNAAAVLASNTSGLSITAIASRCAKPERVVTTHFWNPPHLMPLVEIVRGEKTSLEVAEAMRRLLAGCGKTPVIVNRDRPGQLGNRLQMALVREAAHIIAEGIADADAIDTVVKNGFGLRMPAYGILEHIDVVGLDMAGAVLEYVARDLFSEPRAPDQVREMVRRGDLGAKSGRGFYDWTTKSADQVRTIRDEFLIEVLQYRRRRAQSSSA